MLSVSCTKKGNSNNYKTTKIAGIFHDKSVKV